MALIVLGWIQYILLVLSSARLFHSTSSCATRRGRRVIVSSSKPLRDHGAAARAAISTGQLLLRGLVVVATLAIWPFALLMVLLRLNWPFDSTAIEAMMQNLSELKTNSTLAANLATTIAQRFTAAPLLCRGGGGGRTQPGRRG